MNLKPLTKKTVLKILKNVKIKKLFYEIINVVNSQNRIISKDISSSINVPPFKNSAVDGFAIIDSDINNKSRFKIISKITAGNNKKTILKTGEAARIFTGAKMPNNSNTVVMQENALIKNDSVIFTKKPKKFENCRFEGEDIYKKQIIFKKGQIIKTNNQSLLASIGLKKIKVYKKLSVGFFTSGNELRNPTKKLSGSLINNSNKYALNSLISQLGFKATYLGILKDDHKKIKNLIKKKIKNFDVIITTGGASVGDEDHLINVIKNIGKIIFWKIAIKPGRPLALGFVNQKPIICLPGNPVSVFLLFSLLIKPFLLRLAGSKWDEPKFVYAKIDFRMKKKTSRMEWLRVKINKKIINDLVVSKYPKQGSGIISSIAYSDGIIEIPENKSILKPKEIYKFYPTDFLY